MELTNHGEYVEQLLEQDDSVKPEEHLREGHLGMGASTYDIKDVGGRARASYSS